jgi:hypothetical protein
MASVILVQTRVSFDYSLVMNFTVLLIKYFGKRTQMWQRKLRHNYQAHVASRDPVFWISLA